ncbi:MAG TPA: twin-arginine translocase subunit TatC [Verrucomicrobiae bacterium]|jgi:sec-independent protein translocase protein TatC
MADFSPEPPDDDGGPIKSFLEHLEDFRWVLVKISAALALAMLICLLGANYVMAVIKWPLTRATVSYPGTNQVVTVSFGTNQLGHFELSDTQQAALNLGTNRFVAVTVEPIQIGTNQVLGWHVDPAAAMANDAQQMQIELVNLSPAGGFFVAIQIAFYGGLVLAAPFLMFFIFSFIFPALKLREKKYVFRALFIGGGLFLIGVCFCYFALMPVALAASQKYSNWLGLGASQWRAEEYISFVCRFMLGMGLGFELPVVILTLVKIGVLSHQTLAKARRYMIVINLVLGAVLTTPEVVTQILMFVPLQFLYELTVWVSWYWDQPDRAKAQRRLLAVLAVVLLVIGGLVWAVHQYGLPAFLRALLRH